MEAAANGTSVRYERYFWGEVLRGAKIELQAFGLGIGRAFPGENGGPKRALHVTDPRGFPARIARELWADGYEAHIEYPGREPSPEPEFRECAPGVRWRPCIHENEYVGTADALVAARLVRAGQFPGQPGMRKVIVTVFADGSIPTGPPTVSYPQSKEIGARSVTRRSSSTFRIRVRVGEDEAQRRRTENARVEAEWRQRQARLPIPLALRPRSLAAVEREMREAQAAKTDPAFSRLLGGLLADKRLTLVRCERLGE